MQHFITQYGYLAVFLLMLAESACIPIPSEVIMLFGGALAAGAVAGAHPSLVGIIIAGVLGNVAGSYVAWAVGKYAGLAAVRRWGRRVGIREREIDRATAWFERHGSAAVLVGRVVPVVRTFISLPAGFAAMPAGRFGLYTTLGCIPWTAALGIAGYALGANWQSVANGFHGPTYAIAGIIAVALVAAVILHLRRRRAADRVLRSSGSQDHDHENFTAYTLRNLHKRKMLCDHERDQHLAARITRQAAPRGTVFLLLNGIAGHGSENDPRPYIRGQGSSIGSCSAKAGPV